MTTTTIERPCGEPAAHGPHGLGYPDWTVCPGVPRTPEEETAYQERLARRHPHEIESAGFYDPDLIVVETVDCYEQHDR